ncbi:MAG: permease [Vulcanimicrobiaceae bacterium]
MIVLHAVGAGLLTALQFLWDSFFGLVFGFLISAIVQVALTPRTMHRYLGPNLRGIAFGTAFGIIASACSYGAAAAARGFYQRGADVRAVFAFLISSTNMNVAILILFWSLLGWKFAFAEFFGGIIIIAVVATGFSVLFRAGELERLRLEHSLGGDGNPIVTECPLCGMEGEPDLGVAYKGRTYLACGRKHYADLSSDPGRYVDAEEGGTADAAGWTWRSVADTALGDLEMLRTELIIGYLVAGFAAALVPAEWFSRALQAVGAVPYGGFVLLLLVGLLLAVASFVCSMGNVPVARFLANAGIPLGANVAFIYGDLLVPPLVAIYAKSFPPKVTAAFVGLFVVGAMAAGAAMEFAIGDVFGGVTMGSMTLNDRLTLVSNLVAVVVVIFVAVASRTGTARGPATG